MYNLIWFDVSAFQTVGGATWKFRRPSCVLVEGTSMSWRSAERRFARPEMRRLGCRRCWSRQDRAHGHSQTHRLLCWTVFAVARAAKEARREEPAWRVRICQHRRPDGRQRSVHECNQPTTNQPTDSVTIWSIALCASHYLLIYLLRNRTQSTV